MSQLQQFKDLNKDMAVFLEEQQAATVLREMGMSEEMVQAALKRRAANKAVKCLPDNTDGACSGCVL